MSLYPSYSMTYAQRPAAGNAGRRIVLTDAMIPDWVDDGTQWRPMVGGLALGYEPPTSGSFIAVNQGTSTLTTLSGSLLLTAFPDGTANNRHLYVQNAPATPYTLTVGMILNIWPAPNPTMGGLCFRESSTGKFVEFITYFTNNSNHFATDKATAPNGSFTGYDDGAVQPGWSTQGIIWLRIRDDGTNLSWFWSQDGVSFQPWLSVRPRTDFLASGPNQIGLLVQSLDTTAGRFVYMNVLSWQVTSP